MDWVVDGGGEMLGVALQHLSPIARNLPTLRRVPPRFFPSIASPSCSYTVYTKHCDASLCASSLP